MKTLLLLLLPFFVQSQDTAIYVPPVEYEKVDTLPAILKVQEGRSFTKHVKGYVVLTKDCKTVEFLRINSWRKKERLLPFKGKVVDWRLIKQDTQVLHKLVCSSPSLFLSKALHEKRCLKQLWLKRSLLQDRGVTIG